MMFAQISDCHIPAGDALAYGRFNNAERLRRALRVLNALRPRPDFVLATGDLTQGWTTICTASGTTAATGPGLVSELNHGDVHTIVVRDTVSITSSARRFLRVRVTSP